MQVYLLKDLPGKGKKGEIINVNDGYGRNFILKNKIGAAVNASILNQVKQRKDYKLAVLMYEHIRQFI